MLVKDPVQRWSLDLVQMHPWFVQVKDEKPELTHRPYAQRPFKKKVQKQVEEVRGYDEPLGFATRALMRVF